MAALAAESERARRRECYLCSLRRRSQSRTAGRAGTTPAKFPQGSKSCPFTPRLALLFKGLENDVFRLIEALHQQFSSPATKVRMHTPLSFIFVFASFMRVCQEVKYTAPWQVINRDRRDIITFNKNLRLIAPMSTP